MAIIMEHTEIEEMQARIMNWDTVPEKVKEHLQMGIKFSISHDGNNLMVYTERALHADCTILEEKNGQVKIVDCWILGGKNIWK